LNSELSIGRYVGLILSFSIYSVTRLGFYGMLATDCWFSVRYQVFNHFSSFMSVRLGHQVRRSFVVSSNRFVTFKFIAQINDLNNQTVTSKSSGTSSSTCHQIISWLMNVFFDTNLSIFPELSTSIFIFFSSFSDFCFFITFKHLKISQIGQNFQVIFQV